MLNKIDLSGDLGLADSEELAEAHVELVLSRVVTVSDAAGRRVFYEVGRP